MTSAPLFTYLSLPQRACSSPNTRSSVRMAIRRQRRSTRPSKRQRSPSSHLSAPMGMSVSFPALDPGSHHFFPGWTTCTTRAPRPRAAAPWTGRPSSKQRIGRSLRSSTKACATELRRARRSSSTAVALTVRTLPASSKRSTNRRFGARGRPFVRCALTTSHHKGSTNRCNGRRKKCSN